MLEKVQTPTLLPVQCDLVMVMVRPCESIEDGEVFSATSCSEECYVISTQMVLQPQEYSHWTHSAIVNPMNPTTYMLQPQKIELKCDLHPHVHPMALIVPATEVLQSR